MIDRLFKLWKEEGLGSMIHILSGAIKRRIHPNNLLNAFDYHLISTSVQIENGKPYEYLQLPNRIYAPWQIDSEFLSVNDVIDDFTMLDIYRQYLLWQTVAEVSDVSGVILEIGTWKGGSGCLIAERASLLGIDCNVYLCDTFDGVVKQSEMDPQYEGGEYSNASPEHIYDLSESLDISPTILEGVFPDETAEQIQEESIRMCHIDVDVYKGAKDVYDWVWPRLSKGGVIVLDDYGFSNEEGIERFVREHFDEPGKFVLYNLTGQAIMVKTE